jgi:hypothetical protein
LASPVLRTAVAITPEVTLYKSVQHFCATCIMDTVKQLAFLRMKYKELSIQYLEALNDGKSAMLIKDLSYVLKCLADEIALLEAGINKTSSLTCDEVIDKIKKTGTTK